MRAIFILLILLMPSLLQAGEPAAVPAVPAVPAAAAPTVAAKPSPATAQLVRIGYVDIFRAATDSTPGKALKARLEARKAALQEKLLARRKQLDKLRDSIEAKLAGMSQQQRAAKGKEFQKKVEEFQKMGRDAEEELAKYQESETETLYAEIEKASAALGKANGLVLVVVKKDLLYVSDGIAPQDLTDAVLKSLNEVQPKK